MVKLKISILLFPMYHVQVCRVDPPEYWKYLTYSFVMLPRIRLLYIQTWSAEVDSAPRRAGAHKKSKLFCFKIELHGKPVEPGTRCGFEGLQSLILTHLELRRPSSLHTERTLSPHFQVRHAPHACPAKRKRLTHIVRSLHLDPPSHASTYFPSTSKPY